MRKKKPTWKKSFCNISNTHEHECVYTDTIQTLYIFYTLRVTIIIEELKFIKLKTYYIVTCISYPLGNKLGGGGYFNVLRPTTGRKNISSRNSGTTIMDTIHFLCVFCEPTHHKCSQYAKCWQLGMCNDNCSIPLKRNGYSLNKH